MQFFKLDSYDIYVSYASKSVDLLEYSIYVRMILYNPCYSDSGVE